MLKVKEYVVIIEDFDGMKLWEVCFPRSEMAHTFISHINLPPHQTAVLIERMA